MSVKNIFLDMEYGNAPENATAALAWVQKYEGKFGHFINGAFTESTADFASINPATNSRLATLSQATQADVDAAVAAARAAQKAWQNKSGHDRARVLYALARLVQKHARMLAVLETLDNGKPIRESRDIDIPLVQRHFYYHAGMAQLMDSALPQREALGVCGQIVPWNFPLLMLAWKVAPALAMGNTVVLKPAEYTSLTALRFGEICQEAGVPDGVVNIVTGDGQVGEMIVKSDVDKIAFTGSTAVGKSIREATAGSGKALTLELGGKSAFIVFDDADIDSAIEGVVDAIWFNQGQVCCAGSRLLVQETIAERFYAKLKTRMNKLRLGNPLDKSIDMGAIVDQSQLEMMTDIVGKNERGEPHQHEGKLPDNGFYYPPTLITGLHPADELMQEEIFGPVLAATTFRTHSEAIEIANNTRYGLAASLWSENINLALDVAPKLCAGVVWINGTNMFDAAAGFGGRRESGFGREGGWEGLSAYTKPKEQQEKLTALQANEAPKEQIVEQVEALDRTAKLYIGGKQARPDSGYSQAVYSASQRLMGHVPLASAKDLRNAVEAAHAAKGWARTSGHLRAQILYYIGENLNARADEFAARIDALQGGHQGKQEVERAIDRLFTYGAWADKYDGQVHSVPMRTVSLAMKEPVGVIGAFCPDRAPLLGLISLMAPAIAMGNRVILSASETYPLLASDFYQVLDTSDVPAGVVNILTGAHEDVVDAYAKHMDIDALWSFSASDLSQRIEHGSASNLKRTWVNYGYGRDWFGSEGEGEAFLEAATEVKNIWIPYGE